MKNKLTQALRNGFHSGDRRVVSTDGHAILPCWIKENPTEYMLPYNQVHFDLLEGEALDSRKVEMNDMNNTVSDE